MTASKLLQRILGPGTVTVTVNGTPVEVQEGSAIRIVSDRVFVDPPSQPRPMSEPPIQDITLDQRLKGIYAGDGHVVVVAITGDDRPRAVLDVDPRWAGHITTLYSDGGFFSCKWTGNKPPEAGATFKVRVYAPLSPLSLIAAGSALVEGYATPTRVKAADDAVIKIQTPPRKLSHLWALARDRGRIQVQGDGAYQTGEVKVWDEAGIEIVPAFETLIARTRGASSLNASARYRLDVEACDTSSMLHHGPFPGNVEISRKDQASFRALE